MTDEWIQSSEPSQVRKRESGGWQPPEGRVRTGFRLPVGWLLWVVWAGALAGASHIYFESPDFSSIPGMGEILESHAAASEVARVLSVRVAAGQRVRAGELMMTFDPAPVDIDLAAARANLARCQSNLEATLLALRRERMSEERAFEKSIDVTDMGLIGAQVMAQVDQAEAEGLRIKIRWWESLVARQLVSEQNLQELRAQLAAVEQRLVARQTAVDSWNERLDKVERRWQAWKRAVPSADDDPMQRDIAPLKAQVDVAKAQLAQVEMRRDHLTVRASVDGVVSRVLMQPGDVATPGQTAVVLRAPEVRRVIAYALDTVARRLRIGASVHVQRRDGSGRLLKAHVEGFGGVAPLPLQLQSVPARAPLAAEEIVIVLEEGTLLPGEPVDVAFLEGVMGHPYERPGEPPTPANAPIPEDLPAAPSVTAMAVLPARAATAVGAETGTAAAAPGPATAAPPQEFAIEPKPLLVPPELAALSRFEPSGLVWVPELMRYLVVSDDTGQPDRDEHAPWLFALDADGRVDPGPHKLARAPEISDLESISRAADGALWMLCSQSLSKKGNRKDPRTWLLKAELGEEGLVVRGKASLATAMGRWRSPAALQRLGLMATDPGYRDGAAGFDRVLDIEGLAVDGDGLLLGLKRPLDGEGKAIIWRLSQPEKLLKTGRLDPIDLQVWGHVALTAGPAAAPMAAGIADLLRLPDSRLLILATALGDGDEGRAELGLHSALYVTDGRPVAGRLIANKIMDFHGRHGEGMAVTGDAKSLVVVFDEGATNPHWLKLPIPPL